MSSIVPAIKRCDMLLMAALRHIKEDNTQAAASDLVAALNQLRATIALLTPLHK